ncbi:FtsK/SpoIIIE domain-containing protein [Conchiformibius steedae]|uniref:DNA translocase FtsK n=1 Tax=Conchiformibius steedae TaxID=153493 RepID=A0A3P2A894_9NEIS|nr:FtsK/SpoIIIE domain-containing protein [Conchiformibius steedae]RRD89843.1 DNA translocase FtsK [Conchiformibius steedae]
MYHTKNGLEWDAELMAELLGKHLPSSKFASDTREKLVRSNAIPRFYKDKLYAWAMLCIAYALARDCIAPPKLQHAPDAKGSQVPDLKTCFQDEYRLWLAYISDALFEYKQAVCTVDDLYSYIKDLWHTGALLLDKKWEDCRAFKSDSILEARQLFLSELAQLAKKNSGSRQASSKLSESEEGVIGVLINDARLKNTLQNIGLSVKKLLFSQKGVREDIYRVAFGRYEEFVRKQNELCSNLGIDNKQLRIKRCIDGEANSYEIFVQRPKNTWQQFGEPEFQAALKTYSEQYLLPICLGFNELGKPFFADLAIAPHVMIGGATGSGKSVFVRSVLYSLFALNAEHGKLEVAIADGKSMDFQVFEKYQNLYQRKIFVSPEEIATMLNEHLADMEERKSLCKQYAVSHLSDLPDNIRPPYRVIVVDELAYLKEHDKNGEMESALVQLTAQARATGIYLILCTQRPDSNTFKGQLRTNTPSRIALKVGKNTESRIILDETGAEKLSGRGDHLLKWTELPETMFLHGYNV